MARRLSRVILSLLLLAQLAACTSDGEPTADPSLIGDGNTLPARPTATLRPTAAEALPTTEAAATAEPPTAAPAPTASGAPEFQRTLQLADPRMQGDDVAAVQQRLIDLFFFGVGEVDGYFGPNTQSAVSSFQQLNGLVANGIVDQQTWATLFSATAVDGQALLGDPEGFHVGSIMYLNTDGRSIQVRSVGGNDDREAFLLDINPDAEQVTALSADPLGRFVAVHTDQNRVQIYKLDGYRGSLQATYENLLPVQWSPDGSRFLAPSALDEPAAGQIFIYAADGGDGAAPLETLIGYSGSWLPSGDQVVLSRYPEIILHTLSDDSERTLYNMGEDWFVQSVYVSPSDPAVLFYAGQTANLGASGNGMQWWAIPLEVNSAGCAQAFYGCEAPVALSGPGGNLVDEVALNGTTNLLAYAENASSNACISYEEVYIANTHEIVTPISAPVDLPSEGQGRITQGLSILPDGTALVFSYQPYVCEEGQIIKLTPQIYFWDLIGAGDFDVFGEGAFPFWVP